MRRSHLEVSPSSEFLSQIRTLRKRGRSFRAITRALGGQGLFQGQTGCGQFGVRLCRNAGDLFLARVIVLFLLTLPALCVRLTGGQESHSRGSTVLRSGSRNEPGEDQSLRTNVRTFSLSPHVFSGLVLADSRIDRVPQSAGIGPLNKTNLHDKRWPNPPHLSHILGRDTPTPLR